MKAPRSVVIGRYARCVAAGLSLAGTACGTAVGNEFVAGLQCLDLNDASVESTREIRMVLLYTNAAAAGGDIEGEIELAVLETNVAFQVSKIPIRLVLAHMEQVTMTELDFLGMLTNLTAGTAPLDVGHTLREKYHADVVGVLRTAGGGFSNLMPIPSMAHRDQAFLVVGRYNMNAAFAVAHELGHLLGGMHGRGIPPSPAHDYAYPFACTGCVVDGIRGWHTIISGPLPTDVTGINTSPIGYYSNPDVLFFGEPTGVPIGDPAAADNRASLTQTSTLVAAFRYTPVWFGSLRAEGPWFEKKVDNAMIPDIRIGDFNGDGLSDAFRIDATTNEWFVSYSASQPWKLIWTDPRKIPVDELRFGHFTDDARTDVMYVDVVANEWRVWKNVDTPASDWALLNNEAAASAIPVTQLALGHLNNDARTDVFWSNASTGVWSVAWSGEGPWVAINTDPSALKFNTSELRLANFDNDDRIADVFRVDAGSETWFVSKNGTSPWVQHNGPDAELAVDIANLAIGDFNGDGVADVLYPNGTAWGVAWSGKGKLQLQKLSCTRIHNMALGDFDGDKSTDVLRAGIRP